MMVLASRTGIIEQIAEMVDGAFSLLEDTITDVRGSKSIERSYYAPIFARKYNTLVGMGQMKNLVSLYDGLDPRGTGRFIATALEKHGCTRVFDSCGGCQYDTIFLSGMADRGEMELDLLTSNEVDNELRKEGLHNLAVIQEYREMPRLNMTTFEWQRLTENFLEGAFDATLCMGNSLSHLSQPEQRRMSIANMACVTDEMLIIDTRNYHPFLAHREHLLSQAKDMIEQGSAHGGNKNLFPGAVANFPVLIDDDRVMMAYVEDGQKSPYGLVQFFPITLSAFTEELGEFFEEIEVYGDGEPLDTSKDISALNAPSTFQCVCTKPKRNAARLYCSYR